MIYLLIYLLISSFTFAKTELEVNPFFYGFFWGEKEGRQLNLICGLSVIKDNYKYGAKIKQVILDDNKSISWSGNYLRRAKRYTFGLNSLYNNFRDEFQFGIDAGHIPFKKFNYSVGYIFSCINSDYHMLALKSNFPIIDNLKYKYHMRSAFTDDRLFEWWTQIEYSLNLGWVLPLLLPYNDTDFKTRLQADYAFNKIHIEIENVLIFKFGGNK